MPLSKIRRATSLSDRLEALLVPGAIIVIALSVALTLWAGIGVEWPVAALAGIGTAMSLLAIAALAARPAGQVAASDARVAALEEQVAALTGRVAALDNALVEFSRTTVRAVASELDIVGSVVRDLAEAVAAHDAELFAPRADTEAPRDETGGSPRIASSRLPEPARPAAVALGKSVTGASLAATVPPAAANASPRLPLPRVVAERTADAVLREALEVMLQPVVTLPSRKLRYYDLQLRVPGERVETGDLLATVEERGLARRFDGFALGHAARIARNLAGRGREVPVLCTLTSRAVSDPALYQAFCDIAGADPTITGRILLVVPQATLRVMGAVDREGMAGIAALGFRFALDRLEDLNVDPRALHERGFRIVRATVPLLLGAEQGTVHSEIHPADLSGLLARSGLTLIADGIEADGMLPGLAEFMLPLGQGSAFGAARPVRMEVLGDAEQAAPAAVPAARAAATPQPAAPAATPEAARQSLRSFLRRAGA